MIQPQISRADVIASIRLAFPTVTAVDFLDAGSFGDTFRLEEPTGITAIKVLRPNFDIARTEREISSLARLNSKYVVRFIDEGYLRVAGHNLRYFRTEFLAGSSLRKHLQQGHTLTNQEIKKLLIDVGSGLRDMQANALTHRDLKPENIMLDGARYVIIDLGLAKEDGAASLTLAGDFLGTPQYASLEQLMSAKNVDIRTDLFSLGLIAYECSKGNWQFAYHLGRAQDRAGCIANLRLGNNGPNLRHLGSLAQIVNPLLQVPAYLRLNSPAALLQAIRSI